MVHDAEGDALDPFDEVVDCLGRPIRHTGCMPGANLVAPTQQGPAELVSFDWMVIVWEVAAEPFYEVGCQGLISVVVDAPDDLLGMPHCPDVAAGVTSE